MSRITANEISEHDQLILMMARHFSQLGYSNIKADLPGWDKPDYIYWSSNPNKKYYPDLTCKDKNGVYVILEAETCSTLNDDHTHDQFNIFRAHATNLNGRFEVVVPKYCNMNDGRERIKTIAKGWGIIIDNIWTPGN